MKGNIFTNKFKRLLGNTDTQNKMDRYSDKKSDLIIKQREELKNIKNKQSQQMRDLRLKHNSSIVLLKKKHREQSNSLYGRTMN